MPTNEATTARWGEYIIPSGQNQEEIRPMIRTITTAETHATKVYQEIIETLTNNPALHCPPSLDAIFAAELEGDIWNFKTGKFEAEDA